MTDADLRAYFRQEAARYRLQSLVERNRVSPSIAAYVLNRARGKKSWETRRAQA